MNFELADGFPRGGVVFFKNKNRLKGGDADPELGLQGKSLAKVHQMRFNTPDFGMENRGQHKYFFRRHEGVGNQRLCFIAPMVLHSSRFSPA